MIRVLFAFLSLALAAGREVPLDEVGNTIEFRADGRPGAVRVVGKLADASALTGSLKISQMQVGGEFKVKLDALETGIALRDKHMKQNYLETGKFPVSRFKLQKMALPDNLRRQVGEAADLPFSGSLSLHGLERPVSGTARVIREKARLMLAFEFSVHMGEFGIAVPSFLGVRVGDEVRVRVELAGKLR